MGLEKVKCVFTDLLFTRHIVSRVERKSAFRVSGSCSFLFLIHRRPACGVLLFLEGHLREDQQV